MNTREQVIEVVKELIPTATHIEKGRNLEGVGVWVERGTVIYCGCSESGECLIPIDLDPMPNVIEYIIQI